MSSEICSGLQWFTASHNQVPISLGRKALLGRRESNTGLRRRATESQTWSTTVEEGYFYHPQSSPKVLCIQTVYVKHPWQLFSSIPNLPFHKMSLVIKLLTCIQECFSEHPSNDGLINCYWGAGVLHHPHSDLFASARGKSYFGDT